MEERYIACMVLHGLGDTIGFRNGLWEFKKDKTITYEESLELLFEFIDLGGINEINLKDWFVSDDTIFHMDVAESIYENINNYNKIFLQMQKTFKKSVNKMENDNSISRFIGETIKKNILLSENNKLNDLPYDNKSGGSGVAMRSSCIGLIFKNDLDKLIDVSIRGGQITHSSPIGYLGGLVSAYFTFLAINDVNIIEWPYKLIDLLKSDKILSYISDDGKIDYYKFIYYWERYIETRFSSVNKKPIYTRATKNILLRNRYYISNFIDPDIKDANIGTSGYNSVIVAYDSLLDAKNNWEKLVIYAMLNAGDTDTIGAIAGSWYGTLYGFGNVPTKNLEHLEFKKELIDIGKKLFMLN